MNKVPDTYGKPRFNTLILMHPICGIEAISEAMLLVLSFSKAPFRRKGKKMEQYFYKKTEAEGEPTVYSVCVNGEWVEVKKEVFDFMKKDDRRQRYLDKREHSHCIMSLDELLDKSEKFDTGYDVPRGMLSPSAEDDFFQKLMEIPDARIMDLIGEQISVMDEEDRLIATAIIMNGETLQACSIMLDNMPIPTIWVKLQRIRAELYEMCKEVIGDEWQ